MHHANGRMFVECPVDWANHATSHPSVGLYWPLFEKCHVMPGYVPKLVWCVEIKFCAPMTSNLTPLPKVTKKLATVPRPSAC